MEDNKENRSVEQDTVVFKRAVYKNGVPKRSDDPSSMMQNTAQIQGGAVIRPLKSSSSPNPHTDDLPQRPTNPQAQTQRPANPQAQPQRPANAQAQPQRPANVQAQPQRPVNVQAQPQRPTNAQAQPQRPTNVQAQPQRPTNPQAQQQRPMNTQAQPQRPTNAQAQPQRPTNAQAQPQRPVNAQAQPQRPANPQAQPQRPVNPQAQPQRPAGAQAQPQRPQNQSEQINWQRTPNQPERRPSPSGQGQPELRQISASQQSAQKYHPLAGNQPTQNDAGRLTTEELAYLRELQAQNMQLNSRSKKRQKKYSYAADSASSAVISLVKAIVYIIAVIAISVVLSVFAINTANDVFKFVGEEKIITVEIPEYATISDIADVLYEAKVIKYPWAFELWSNLKEDDEEPPVFVAGTYEVSTMLNYDYLRSAFKNIKATTEVRITIPEGFTVDEIISLFVDEYGIGTREGFIEAINNYDYDYRFLDGLEVSPDRYYRLEGYLFPDTYYFYSTSTEVSVINKLLSNFNKKFIGEYYDRCTDLGMTIDEAIILASMVEKEAKYSDELGNISSVFHNRLKYNATFQYLQSDATIMYAIQHDTGDRLNTMTGEDTSYDSPYNTYKHRGLPPGPIANPGLNAIVYALYPNETEYFYFVANSQGRSLFAKTASEHEQNIIIARQN